MIPYGEKIVSDYLRSGLDGVRVVGKTPSDTSSPWVRVTQLDARPVGGGSPPHHFEFYFQLDCYAGRDGGQPEANAVARQVAEVIGGLEKSNHAAEGSIVTGARANAGHRAPDPDFEPARERFISTATVWIHS